MTKTRRVGGILGVLATGAGVLLGVLGAAPGAVAAAGADGPGSYYVLRSQATGNPPKPADDAACNAYLGFPQNVATIQRLDATLFAPVVSTAGEITNGVAAAVTPAYLCGALGADGGLITSYAKTRLPEAGLPQNGRVEVAGPCGVSLGLAQLGAATADCRLNPIAGAGGVSGVFTTNSIVNPLGVSGPQTGSLITGYVLGAPHTDPGAAPTAAPQPVPGANFYVFRAGASTTAGGSSDCPFTWRARTTKLYAAHPAASTGRVGDASGPQAGTVTTCFEKKQTTGTFRAKAVVRLTGRSVITSEGTCTHQALTGVVGSAAQTCGLWVKAPLGTIEDGLVSATTLVPAGDPAGSTNNGVWTVATLT